MKSILHTDDDDHDYREGDEVSLDVTWQGGRTVRMTGTLITVDARDAYVQTDYGTVAGSLHSLEPKA